MRTLTERIADYFSHRRWQQLDREVAMLESEINDLYAYLQRVVTERDKAHRKLKREPQQ